MKKRIANSRNHIFALNHNDNNNDKDNDIINNNNNEKIMTGLILITILIIRMVLTLDRGETLLF